MAELEARLKADKGRAIKAIMVAQIDTASGVVNDIPAIAHACRRLHAGEAFTNDFDIFAKRVELLALCARHDIPSLFIGHGSNLLGTYTFYRADR